MRNDLFESACELSNKAKELRDFRITFFNMYMDEWLKEAPPIGSETTKIQIEVNGRILNFDFLEGCKEVMITDEESVLLYDHDERELKYTFFSMNENSIDYAYCLNDNSFEEILTFYRGEKKDSEYSFKYYLD